MIKEFVFLFFHHHFPDITTESDEWFSKQNEQRMKDKMTWATIKMMKYSTLSLLKRKQNATGTSQQRMVFTVCFHPSTASELTQTNDVLFLRYISLKSLANKLYGWIWFIEGKSLYSPKWCFITKFHWIFADFSID